MRKPSFFDEGKLKERIEEGVFYSKNKAQEVMNNIEGILPELLALYTKSETAYQQFILRKLALKSPYSLGGSQSYQCRVDPY